MFTNVTPEVTPESPMEGTDGEGGTSGTYPVDQAAHDALKAQYEALKADADAFKRDVIAVTSRYAQAHNLCSVADQALAELGLRRVQTGHRVTVNLSASWEVMTLSRGRSGAPTPSSVWSTVETLVRYLRRDGVDDTVRRYRDDLLDLVITTADVKVETAEPSPDAHLIPPVRTRECLSCGHFNPMSASECTSCDSDMDDD